MVHCGSWPKKVVHLWCRAKLQVPVTSVTISRDLIRCHYIIVCYTYMRINKSSLYHMPICMYVDLPLQSYNRKLGHKIGRFTIKSEALAALMYVCNRTYVKHHLGYCTTQNTLQLQWYKK